MNVNPGKVTIRPMTTADLPRVLEIDRQSFSSPWSEQTYHYELERNPTARLLVAEMDRDSGPDIVGYIGTWMIVDECHISTLAVDRQYRRRGIGEALLIRALDRAVEAGATTASLEVRVSNQGAQRLYRKYGFEVTARRRGYYRDNEEDAFVMVLDELRLPVAARREVAGER